MKTNVIMVRPMGNFEVLQRTSDGFFDGNALLTQWNSVSNNTRRRMDKFLESNNTKEFIDELKNEMMNQKLMVKNDHTDYQVVNEIKGRKTKKGQTANQVWMHPYLFIKFAMYINPRFEVQVIKFVYDQLISFRNDAGDKYNILTTAIASIPNIDYKKVATAMNWIVFNRNGKNLRQTATQKQLEELSYIEHTIATMVDLGFIKNNEQLVSMMRGMYNKKYQKF